MSELRILTVIESLARAGAEQALVNVLPELKAQGHTVEVAVLWSPYTLAEDLETAGVPVHRLGLSHRWNLAQGIPRLARICRQGRFDVIHSHLFFSGLYSTLTRPLTPRIKRVVTFHNLGYDSYPADNAWRKVRKRLDGLLMRHAVDGRIAVSTAVARHYQSHLKLPPVSVLPNGFPVQTLRPDSEPSASYVRDEFGLSAEDFVLLFAGRYVHEKGHRFFLEALDVLRREGKRPKALIVGDGPLAVEVADEIARRGLEGQVMTRPSMPHAKLMDLLRESDLLVMASTHEGFPLSPAEAMALGKPVLATQVGGLPDLIEDGVSGALVPPQDPRALADGIARFMTDPEWRQQLAAGGRERVVSRFSSEHVACRLVEAYRAALGPV
jgi:glycosyltransferase involved in cell wall biosynthesis